ncbi:uncharacterized protein LOC106180675 [Lingula anatina]|uniref:Uncharacterized protein LOC106180675 n=1 Tax=Lingula anatina TaxID=7574 RepID=A0A1S3KC24_LINAN|nr:uncharacterized protein LOC106180675 [Lingula anatina]|eukprot:XP_013420183.1 uncharacterized protein LOC106180675 [Lingula anatina]
MTSQATTLRPLGRLENGMFVLHEYGNTTNVFSVWINTKTHVPDDTWERSLILLQKNFPTLRLRVVQQDVKRHFKFMDDPHVDFEAQNLSKHDDWKDLYENLLQVRFDTVNGPLWKAKILRLPHSTGKKEGVEDSEFGHASILMFVFHHCITDGKSNIIMLSRLVHILNAVIGGEAVEENDITTLKPTTEHLIPKENLKLRLKDAKEIGREIYNNIFPSENLFLKKFPAPQLHEEDTGRTRVVPLKLSVIETENLLAKCKEHRSTVNGIFVSAASIAMSRLINEGSTPRPMNFNTMTSVTFRRYIPMYMGNVLGCFIGPHRLPLSIPADTSDQLWPQAQQITKTFHDALDHDRVLQEYRVLSSLAFEKGIRMAMASKVCDHDFETSNNGDYDLDFPAEDKHVKVTKIVSSTAMQDLHTPCIHYLRKFRGQFLYNLDYATNWMSDKNAHRLANLTVQLMKEASRRNMSTSAGLAAEHSARASRATRSMSSSSVPYVRGLIRMGQILRFAR